jgi:hypothetical protein
LKPPCTYSITVAFVHEIGLCGAHTESHADKEEHDMTVECGLPSHIGPADLSYFWRPLFIVLVVQFVETLADVKGDNEGKDVEDQHAHLGVIV